MPVQWTPDLTVGVGEIDKQHKELFVRVNAMLEAMSQGKAQAEVAKTIEFLGDYVKAHFGMEERSMQTYAYPATAAHKAEHAAFVADFVNARAKFEMDGPSVSLALALQSKICDWLRNHIRKTDKALGAYIQSQK